MILKILEVMLLSSGLTCVIVEFVIRAQVNRHLTPDERIGIHELQLPWVWLGRNGLIVRHKKLYPDSWLTGTFCVLWILFFAALIGLIACAKTAASH